MVAFVVLMVRLSLVRVSSITVSSSFLFSSRVFDLVDSRFSFLVPVTFLYNSNFASPVLSSQSNRHCFRCRNRWLFWRRQSTLTKWSERWSAGPAVSSFALYPYQRLRYSVSPLIASWSTNFSIAFLTPLLFEVSVGSVLLSCRRLCLSYYFSL